MLRSVRKRSGACVTSPAGSTVGDVEPANPSRGQLRFAGYDSAPPAWRLARPASGPGPGFSRREVATSTRRFPGAGWRTTAHLPPESSVSLGSRPELIMPGVAGSRCAVVTVSPRSPSSVASARPAGLPHAAGSTAPSTRLQPEIQGECSARRRRTGRRTRLPMTGYIIRRFGRRRRFRARSRRNCPTRTPTAESHPRPPESY